MIRLLALTLSILMTAACSRQDLSIAAVSAQQPATAVQVKTVGVTSIADIYRASGTVHARQVATPAARIAANILEVRVHAGDHVQPGQTLIVLDRRDLEAHLSLAEAARAEAESAVTETESAVVSARAAQELARVTHKRFQDLLARASVSQQEFDESQARLKSADAALEMALSKRRQIEARRRQSDADLTAARVNLGYATIIAPFAGLITERKVDPGSLATPGMPLLSIEREGDLRLEVSMDESRLGLANLGESVDVEIEGLNATMTGRVGEIVPSIDSATRTCTAKIDLPAMPRLRTGMFGRAAFSSGKHEALMVPQAAILERGQIQYVHVVERDTARLRIVTLGEERGEWREILSGLTPGERIVVAAPPLLADGEHVAVQEASK
jgi:RND family efflux transporter MFP subunit